MKLVVGLGNPGRQYAGTRHNVGFDVLAELANRFAGGSPSVKYQADCVEIVIGSEKVLLVAPQTFMTLSGRSVGQFVTFYKLPLSDLLVICDDMNLPLGKLRLRAGGSAGGQKGLADILTRLGSQDVPRLRVGIGQPPQRVDGVDYVLSRFRSGERDVMLESNRLAAGAVECWVREGLERAMSRFNGTEGAPGKE